MKDIESCDSMSFTQDSNGVGKAKNAVVIDGQRGGWAVYFLLFLQRFLLSKPPTELTCVAQEPLHDVAPQPVDLLNIVPLLGTEAHHFSGFESAVVKQVGQSPFAFVGKHCLENLPHLVTLGLVFLSRWLC